MREEAKKAEDLTAYFIILRESAPILKLPLLFGKLYDFIFSAKKIKRKKLPVKQLNKLHF